MSQFHIHIGTGLTLQGLWSRPDDSLGAAVSAVQFNAPTDRHTYEASFEAFYKLHLTRYLRLVADAQFIEQIGGPQNVPDCIVFTPRLILSF